MAAYGMFDRFNRDLARLPATLIVLALSQANAKPVTMRAQGVKVQFNAEKATDEATNIYLELKGDGGKLLTNSQVRITATDVTSKRMFKVKYTGDSFVLTADGFTVADGKDVIIQARAINVYNGKISVQRVVFRNNKNQQLDNGKGVGGTMTGDPTYTLFNDLIPSVNLSVQNLVFYENHAAVDFCTLDPAVPVDSSGISQTGAFLNGTGSSQDYSVPPILDGTFFISQGQVFTESSSSPAAWFVDGYTTTPQDELDLGDGLINFFFTGTGTSQVNTLIPQQYCNGGTCNLAQGNATGTEDLQSSGTYTMTSASNAPFYLVANSYGGFDVTQTDSIQFNYNSPQGTLSGLIQFSWISGTNANGQSTMAGTLTITGGTFAQYLPHGANLNATLGLNGSLDMLLGRFGFVTAEFQSGELQAGCVQ